MQENNSNKSLSKRFKEEMQSLNQELLVQNKVNFSVENFHNNFCVEKNNPKDTARRILAFVTKMREDLQNNIYYGATSIDIAQMLMDGSHYYVFGGNSEPWKNFETLQKSLFLNTSINKGGCQGCGGKLCSMCLVKKIADFQTHFLSFTNGQWLHAFTHWADYNTQIVRQADPALTRRIQKILGNLMDRNNVLYISAMKEDIYHGNALRFCNHQTMTTLINFVDDLIRDKTIKVRYHPEIIFSEQEKYNDVMKRSDKTSTASILRTAEEFDERFMDSSYLFEEVRYVIDSQRHHIYIKAYVPVKLYSGNKKSDGQGTRRYNLIAVGQGEQRNQALDGFHACPEFNCYIKSEFIKDDNLHRLREEYHAAEDLISDVGHILNTKLFRHSSKLQFDGWIYRDETAPFENAETQAKGKAIRQPFFTMSVIITEIEQVTNQQGTPIHDLSERDILQLLYGGVHENFMTRDSSMHSKIILGAAEAIAKNSKFAKTLKELRARAEILCPVKYENLIDIDMVDENKIIPLEVRDKDDKVISFIEAKIGDQTNVDVNLFIKNSDGTQKMLGHDDLENVVLYDLKDKELKYSGISKKTTKDSNTKFVLSISSLRRYDEDRKDYIKADSVEEWLSFDQFKTLPNRDIYISNDAVYYKLSCEVKLPERVRNYTGTSKKQTREKGERPFRGINYAKVFEPEEAICKFINNSFIINYNDNNELLTIFRENATSKATAQKIYCDLREYAQSIVTRLEYLQRNPDSDLPKSADVYGKDYKLWFLNDLVIDRVKKDPEIRKAIEDAKVSMRHSFSGDFEDIEM